MKAKFKKTLKYAAMVILGVALFCIGYICQGAQDRFAMFTEPQVRSDSSIRSQIEDKIGSLPLSAYDLYFAFEGLLDPCFFVAFSATRSDCDVFLKRYTGKPIDSFRRVGILPKRVAEHGPDSWASKFKDPNWNLAEEPEVQIYEDGGQTVLYSAGKNRTFICLW